MVASFPPEAAASWRVIGASVAGTSHARGGTPCQDAHRWAILPDGSLVVAVADGAGSASRSEEGARRAVDATIAYLVAALDEGMPSDEHEWHEAIRAAFEEAIASLAVAAEAAGAAMRDYATTLTIVVATMDTFVAAQIGDGIVAAEDADAALFVAATPQRGEYANEVALLTMPDAAERMALAIFPAGVRAFAVTTDGLLRLAVHLPSHAPHAPFFRPLFAFLAESADLAVAEEELVAFLASERVSRRTDDDTTLVLAVRTEGGQDQRDASEAATDAPDGR